MRKDCALSSRGLFLVSVAVVLVAAGCEDGSGTSKVGVISTVVGGGQGGDGGPATSALLAGPTDVACDSDKNLYVVDNGFSNVRKVDDQGTITTVAGTTGGSSVFSGDGGPATAAALNGPLSIALDPTGNLYIADSGNNRIRRLDRKGTITTVAGTGEAGFSGDRGPATAAKLDDPEAIAFDGAGNLYIDDYNANRIRRVDRSGIITTVAGTGEPGFSGDGGPATAATFSEVEDITFDANGDLLIADTSNNRIRRVDQKGIVMTVAGTGTRGHAGDGGHATAATFYDPVSVVADADGNLYVSDHHNDRVRRIDQSGTITAFAGTGARGFSGDGAPATSARLNQPWALTVCDGTLYITDSFNHRVRMVRLSG
jgi:sugar lactone lactonase YvrE